MRASPLMLLFAGCVISLQCVDFWLTWALLEGGVRADVYEANPLANAILARHGWPGLAGYKALCGAVALGAGLLASLRRPAVGLRLLAAECLVMAGVVGWSAVLVQRSQENVVDEVALLERRGGLLSERLEAAQRFHVAREEICRLVMRRESSLHVGLQLLSECIESFRPRLAQAQQKKLPDTQHAGQVAAYLYHHCSRLLDQGRNGEARLESLGRAIGRRFPTAPLVKVSVVIGGEPPTWSCRSLDEG